MNDKKVTDFQQENGEEENYEETFKELRDYAIEKQKKHSKGSIIYQQYQIFIDVSNEMLDMIEDYQDQALESD